MAATVIYGKDLARELRNSLSHSLERLKGKGIVPGLTVVLVGDDPASDSYVRGKEKACLELGMVSNTLRFPESMAQDGLLELISRLNLDDSVDGILVQVPLPKHMDTDLVLRTIDPAKDVDGFHPVSIGKLLLGQETFISCTPHGVVKILEKTGMPLAGLEVVVVGRSNIVGKPMAMLLMQAPHHCTVTVCHTRTLDLKAHTLRADIVIVAAGKPRMVTADMIRPGACVIDVGVNRVPDASKASGFALVGDIDYVPIAEKASFVTPVPGGVGPMTITMLMVNTVKAACLRRGLAVEN
jgi:methylenetetrahydrofolate dehydrogenase (NADP+)/methenyltetrahydrofolate cyclohydrolase